MAAKQTTQPKQATPAKPPVTPPILEKPKPLITLMVLALLLLGATGYLAYQNYQLRQQLSQVQTSPLPTFTSSPAPAISPSPEASLEAKVLKYNLPAGWETITDGDETFSIGYDPEKYNASSMDSRIDLSSKQCCSSFFVKVLSYDGGSRHQFIYDNTGAVETENTYEINYIVDGKSGLVIYNLDLSGNNLAGMVNVDGTRAFLITSQAGSQDLVEQILSTLKSLD